MRDASADAEGWRGGRGAPRCTAAVLLAAGVLVACSSGSTSSAGQAGTGSSGAAPSGSGAPAAASPAASDGGTSTTAATGSAAGTGAGGTSTSSAGPTRNPTATRAPTSFPSPVGMTPPQATAATATGCLQLTGGGWQATFLVTLVGGTQWAVVPQHGPATRTGADQWTVVIRQRTTSGSQITLDRIEVGGGSPFRTATVVLGPGMSATADCHS